MSGRTTDEIVADLRHSVTCDCLRCEAADRLAELEAARRRLVKAAAILADVDSTWRQQLIDLLDTAEALDPPANFAPYLDPDPCPPLGIARPRRGGLIVRLPG